MPSGFLSTPSARRATRVRVAGEFPRQEFLSTPSARRATRGRGLPAPAAGISIHALREEGNRFTVFSPSGRAYFYPRPPRGGRRRQKPRPMAASRFLSTPSARRATAARVCGAGTERFLSTPSARRATLLSFKRGAQHQHFYPRPPRGGRRPSRHSPAWTRNFYPRPPRGGRRFVFHRADIVQAISIHALREEGDQTSMHSSRAD